MSGDDADFAAFVAARWPFLVRTLVLIGCPRDEAEDLAQAALAHCYGEWDRVRSTDDVDAHVYRTLLEVWHRSRRRSWWVRTPPAAPTPDPAPAPTPAAPAPAGDSSDLELLRQALDAQLGQMTPEHREVLVLRFVAGLDDLQIADVVDDSVGTVRSRLSEGLGHLDLAALREMTGR